MFSIERFSGNSLVSRLSYNSAWLVSSRVAMQLGMAAYTVLVARALGSVGFGEYAFVASVVLIGNVLTTFGTDMHLIRRIAGTGDHQDLSAAFVLQLALSAAFVGLVFVFSAANSSQGSAASWSLRVYSLSLFPLAFFTAYTTALRGEQHMQAYSALSVLLAGMQAAAAVWLYLSHGNLIELAVLLLLVQFFGAAAAGLSCHFVLDQRFRLHRLEPNRLQLLMRACAPIALLGLLGIVYQRITFLLLPSLAGIAATGWYAAAARLLEAAKTGHAAVLIALYPLMAQVRISEGARWHRHFARTGLLLLGGALVGSLTLYFFSGPLVRALFGLSYLPTVAVVRVLAWLLIPYAFNSFMALVLLAENQERLLLQSLALSTIILVLLTIWWAPHAGAVGVARASLVSETGQSVFILLTIALRRGQRSAKASPAGETEGRVEDQAQVPSRIP